LSETHPRADAGPDRLPRDPSPDAGATATPVRHKAEIAHATHGRVRLKVPGAKNNLAVLQQLREAFEHQPGIDTVNVKPESGSLVIYYDPEQHPDVASLFLSLGRTEAPAELPVPANGAGGAHGVHTKLDEVTSAVEEEAEFLAAHSHIARSVVASLKSLDRQIKRSTNNNIDLKILAPVGLAAFTFLEIGAAAATPMWVTLVIFSLNHFVELRAHGAAAASDAAR
jgi:hypothetical protein